MHLKHISTPSINHTSKDNLVPFINCGISNDHNTIHTSFVFTRARKHPKLSAPNAIHWHMVKFETQRAFHRVQECVNRSSDDKVMVLRSRSCRFTWVCENCSDPKTKHYTQNQHSASPNHKQSRFNPETDHLCLRAGWMPSHTKS